MARTALNFFVAAAGHPFGHFYHTMYQKYQGSFSLNDAKLFQFLEVGFSRGSGYDLYREFLPRGGCHSNANIQATASGKRC